MTERKYQVYYVQLLLKEDAEEIENTVNKASERIYKKGEIHENWKQFEKMEIFDSWADCNDIGNVRDTAGIGKQHAFCNG